MANPLASDLERAKRIGRYFVGKPRAKIEAYSDADWKGDRVSRRSVSAAVIMRGGHCLKVWTKKQQVVSLSTVESELHAAVKTASEGWKFRARRRTWALYVG